MPSTTSSVGSKLLQQVVSVTAVATKLPTTPLAGRKTIVIQNLSSNIVYIGSSTVTTTGATRGHALDTQYDSIAIDLASNVDLYGIAGSASDVSVLELV